jgi:hypothetical protein
MRAATASGAMTDCVAIAPSGATAAISAIATTAVAAATSVKRATALIALTSAAAARNQRVPVALKKDGAMSVEIKPAKESKRRLPARTPATRRVSVRLALGESANSDRNEQFVAANSFIWKGGKLQAGVIGGVPDGGFHQQAVVVVVDRSDLLVANALFVARSP